jgi:DNA polymerase-3 subunit beta
MKFNIRKDLLSEGIGTVLKAVSNRTTMPILECVLITAEDGGIKLLGNDLELGIETKMIEAEVYEKGKAALDAKAFSDIVRKLPGEEIAVETMGNYITMIKSGVSEFKILGQPGDEFPALPEVESDAGFEIKSGALKDMIRQTIFSVSTDESKPAMTGELMSVINGRLRMASVDGHRISVRYADIDNKELEAEVIVPAKTLGEINKILKSNESSITGVYFSDKHALFETDDALIVSRLIEGKFLDYESIFRIESAVTIDIETQPFADCVERASLLSRETVKNPVKLTINAETDIRKVESTAEAVSFYDEIPARIEGDGMEIQFNPKYLLDILKAAGDERVKIMMTTPLNPCIFKALEGDDYKYLALPIRPRN